MKLFRVLAVTLLLSFTTTAAFAADWQVGDDPFNDFETLGDAFAFLVAEPGTHNIAIADGIYTDINLSCPSNIDAITGGDDVLFMGGSPDNFLDITGCAVAISGLTINGYDLGIVGNAIGGSITDCYFQNIGTYGVQLWASSTGVTVADNCFNGCGSPGSYDSSGLNTWGGNYYDDAVVPAYALDGGVGVFDNAATISAFAATPSGTYNLGDIVEVDIMWDVPACDAGSELAGYEFVVHANDTKLQFVSAAFDKDYLGIDDGTNGSALYIGPTQMGAGDTKFVGVNFSNPGVGTARLATLTYEVMAANTNVWIQVNSTFYNASSVAYVVDSPNNTLTLVDNTDPVLEYYTAHDPVGNATFSTTYPLNVQVGATDDYDLANIQYSLNGGAWTNWQTISGILYDSPVAPGGLSVGLGADGDVRMLEVRAVDAGGNISNVMEYEYTTDLAGPVFSFAMADADMCGNLAGYTNDPTVAVTITTAATDIDQIRTWDGTIWGAYEPYGTFGGFILLDGPDGAKNSAMGLMDLYGNVTQVYADATIMLDQVAPPTTQDFALAGGAAKANSVNTTGDVAGFSAPFYKVSETEADLACDQGDWLTPAHPFAVELSANDGVKTVYFVTMDNAGNQSSVQSDDIELDTTAPTVASVVMDACTNHHASNDVTITFPDLDVVRIYIQDNSGGYTSFGDGSTIMVSPYVASYSMTTGPGNGTVVDIDVQLRDNSQPVKNKGYGATTILMDYGAGVPSLTSITAKDKTSGDLVFSTEDQFAVDIVVPSGSEDIISVEFSHDGVTWQAPRAKDFSGGGTITMWYTPTAPIPQAYNAVYVRGTDCAGNVSADVSDVPGIIIDKVAPVITAVEIDGGAAQSNDLSLTVVLTVTELWPGGGNQSGVELSLTADFAVVQSFAWAGSYEFVLDPGDGERCVFARMTDRAGNASNEDMSDCIEIDMTTPSGSFTIVSYNLLASPGYTDSRAVHFENIVLDDDVVAIAFRNVESDGNELPLAATSTGWIPVNTLVDPSAYDGGSGSFLTAGGAFGAKHVRMLLKDDAGNQNVWGDIEEVIMWNPLAPAAPSSGLTATPVASTLLEWDADADVAEWHIRYSFTGDYPAYADGGGNPLGPLYPVAATMVTGFPAGMDLVTTENSYDFIEGPGPDVYTFTLWALGKNGLMSGPATVTGTNYIMGDFSDKAAESDFDGCLDFEDEFFSGLGLSYETMLGDVGFDPVVDYASFFGADPKGLPDPDEKVNLDDLIVFALNYSTHNCDNEFDPYAKGAVSGPVAISVETPRNVAAGSEFTVSFNVENAAGIFGYHAVFDYNSDVLEVVSVDAGEMYDGIDNPFFHRSGKSDKLDIGSVILGNDAFNGDEMFRVTFKARVSGPVEIEDIQLEFIDAENNPIDVSFANTKTIGELPDEYLLAQNYPNPFNPTTTIEFSLPVASDYSLTIYNIAGQVVTSFVGKADAGVQSIAWDAANNSSGIYFYKLETGTFTAVKKMVLLK